MKGLCGFKIRNFNRILGFLVVTTLLFGLFGGVRGYGKVGVDAQSFVGKTYWVQSSIFAYVDDDLKLQYDFYKSDGNNLAGFQTKDFFIKMKIIDIQSIQNPNDQTKDNMIDYFVVEINGKQYLINTTNITESKTEDYEIFTSDPKLKFKWSEKIWSKLGLPFIGMTTDMLIMENKRPLRINKTIIKKHTLQQWVYHSDTFGDSYYYFDNGKLTSWQENN